MAYCLQAVGRLLTRPVAGVAAVLPDSPARRCAVQAGSLMSANQLPQVNVPDADVSKQYTVELYYYPIQARDAAL